jgi:hypothetical protein
MGCCILGALIISRFITAFERGQQFVERCARVLRATGLYRPALRGRRAIALVAVAELAAIVTIGLDHRDHIVSFLRPALAFDESSICRSESDADAITTDQALPEWRSAQVAQ